MKNDSSPDIVTTNNVNDDNDSDGVSIGDATTGISDTATTNSNAPANVDNFLTVCRDCLKHLKEKRYHYHHHHHHYQHYHYHHYLHYYFHYHHHQGCSR